MRTKFGTVLAAAVAVAEAILINRRSSFLATFAFFAAKTSESIKVVWRRVRRRFLHDLHGYNLCGAAK